MAVYNHTRKLFNNQQITLTTLKVMLVNGYTYDATAVDMTGITPSEVSGNGWTAGGETLTSVTVTTTATDSATLDAANIAVTATGGSIGPADGLVVYDSTLSAPLFYTSFASSQTAGNGTQFLVNVSASGIYVDAP